MKEAGWQDCLEINSVRKITIDKARAKSLIEIAEERITLIQDIVNKRNCNFVFEAYYTSLLELLQALVLLHGFNVANHICLGFYLKDVLKREDLFMKFDDVRYKRNNLVYYGNKMEPEICKDAIDKCSNLIKEIKNLIEELLLQT